MATGDLQSCRILLVGKTGSGKSSTGNSILDKNVFKSRKPYDSSDGDVIACYSSVVDGRYVFVMDGTSIGDTGGDLNGGVKSLLHSVETTMKQEISCFNAIILVHFIHERSQANMKNSVLAIKSILGPNVFKNWGIIVVTFGDLFDVNNHDENFHSFEDWCQQQTGYFQILLEECNNRCVLFDNITTDKNKQMEQRNKLLSVVDNMTYKQYTIDDFDSPICKLSRQHVLLMEEINRTFEELHDNTCSQRDVSKQKLELLMTKLLEHKQLLTRQGQEPELTKQILNQFIETVKKLQLKLSHVFQDIEPTIWEQLEFSRPILFKDEEPATFQALIPFSSPVADLPTTKLTTFVSEIEADNKSTEIDARESQELDIQNETPKEICTILLVGRSGNGKSSVGNSILGRELFKTRGPSEGTRLTSEIRYNDDYVVFDCSGVGDTEADMPGDKSSILMSACAALIINNKQDVLQENETDNQPTVLHKCGFDALIFVMKYGVRCAKEERGAVQMVKSIFGENVFRDWGILVISYGDNFKYDSQDSKKTFKDWCMEHTGDIKTLFDEVKYRCVLFDNKTRNGDKLDQQRTELSEHIQALKKEKNKEVGQNKYCIKDLIAVRTKEIQEIIERLHEKSKQLLAHSNKSDREKLKTALKKEWTHVKKKVEKEIEIFSWGAKSQASSSTNEQSETTPKQSGIIDTVGLWFGQLINSRNEKKDGTIKREITKTKHNKSGRIPVIPKNGVTNTVNPTNSGVIPFGPNKRVSFIDPPHNDVLPINSGTIPLGHNASVTFTVVPDQSGKIAVAPDNSGTMPVAPDNSGTIPVAPDNSGTIPVAPDNSGTIPDAPYYNGTIPVAPDNSGTIPVAPDNSGTIPDAPYYNGTIPVAPDNSGTIPDAPYYNGTIPVAPDSSGTIPVAPDNSGTIPVAPYYIGAIPVAPDNSGTIPVAPDNSGTIPVAPYYSGTIPVAPDNSGTIPVAPYYSGTIPVAPDNSGTIPVAPDNSGTIPVAPYYSGTIPVAPDKSGTIPDAPYYNGTIPVAPDNSGTIPDAPYYNGTIPVAPDSAGTIPVAPDNSGTIPVAPYYIGTIPVAPDNSGTIPVAPDNSGTIPVAPYYIGTIPVAPDNSGTIPVAPYYSGTIPVAPDNSGTIPVAPDNSGTIPVAPYYSGTIPVAPDNSGTIPDAPYYNGTFPVAPDNSGTIPDAPYYNGTIPVAPDNSGTIPVAPDNSGTIPVAPYYSGTIPVAPDNSGTIPDAPYYNGTIPVAPDNSGTIPVSPYYSGTIPVAPDNSGTIPVAPDNSGTIPVAPYYSGTIPVAPDNSGTIPVAPDNSGTIPVAPYYSGTIPVAPDNKPKQLPVRVGVPMYQIPSMLFIDSHKYCFTCKLILTEYTQLLKKLQSDIDKHI